MIRSEGVTILPGAHEVINNLSPIELKLLFYMAGRMERGNLAKLGSKEKREFMDTMRESKKRVKMQGVFNAVSKLRKLGLIKDYVAGSYILSINCFSTVNGTSRMVSLDA